MRREKMPKITREEESDEGIERRKERRKDKREKCTKREKENMRKRKLKGIGTGGENRGGNTDMEEKESPDGEGGREMKRHRITGEEIKGRNREHGE